MNMLRTSCAYKVITHNEIDGLHVDHFCDAKDARALTESSPALTIRQRSMRRETP